MRKDYLAFFVSLFLSRLADQILFFIVPLVVPKKEKNPEICFFSIKTSKSGSPSYAPGKTRINDPTGGFFTNWKYAFPLAVAMVNKSPILIII